MNRSSTASAVAPGNPQLAPRWFAINSESAKNSSVSTASKAFFEPTERIASTNRLPALPSSDGIPAPTRSASGTAWRANSWACSSVSAAVPSCSEREKNAAFSCT